MAVWKKFLDFRCWLPFARTTEPQAVYDQDGLRSIHDHSFMQDPAFRDAYQRGVQAVGKDSYHWEWRVHVGLWAAAGARYLAGDFVECGVNYGFLSSAIMRYLDWNQLDKTFYLLDTFQGLDSRYLSEEAKRAGALDRNAEFLRSQHYVSNVAQVTANFAEWQRVRIIAGSVPETLSEVSAEQVAFLHLDMNCALPEVAALEFFWQRLAPGALVLMDDYCYQGFAEQKSAMDDFAARNRVAILSLPTGQGLLLKPP